ncbi:hypothetical protein P9869_24710 [Streptomyces ossamyceticus]|nr:hypothetical protein [Streptomyces ossamyceticus]
MLVRLSSVDRLVFGACSGGGEAVDGGRAEPQVGEGLGPPEKNSFEADGDTVCWLKVGGDRTSISSCAV